MLPFLPIQYESAEYGFCPYNQKIYLLGKALAERGVDVHLYSYDDSHIPGAKLHVVGEHTHENFVHRSTRYTETTKKALPMWEAEILKHFETLSVSGDLNESSIIVSPYSISSLQKVVHFIQEKRLVDVEYPVSYLHSNSKHKIFESAPYKHFYMGLTHDIKKYSTEKSVFWRWRHLSPILDTEKFVVDSKATKDYILYMGRPIWEKGVELVAQLAENQLLQKHPKQFKFIFSGNNAMYEKKLSKLPNVEVFILPEQSLKRKLLRNAMALMSPTLYVEPFGTSHVEALLCGVPVISTDWGVYTETVEEGINGFRCQTWKAMIAALDKVEALDRSLICTKAHNKYGKQAVDSFDRYFKEMLEYKNTGWYAI